MGLLGKIGKVITGGVLGGPGGAISVFTIEIGGETVEVSIDLARQIVKCGTDVYRAIPPAAFALGGAPIHGLLKNEAEDELILLGNIAGDLVISAGLTWSAAGPFGAAAHLYVSGKLLLGKLHHRRLNDQEWEMARYIFRDSLHDRDDIIITNLAGKDGRPFTYPMAPLGVPVLVNLAGNYGPIATVLDGPLLFHELTHVWQAKQLVLREIFLYETVPDALKEEYAFTPGRQWGKYGTEQQASIVEGWTLGATERVSTSTGTSFDIGARAKLTIGSPLFRYINGNLRRADNGARTRGGRSVKDLLADGGHRTMKGMHTKPPEPWWP